MKRNFSILRILCLVALMCITSVNAYAYINYERGEISINVNSYSMDNDKILVVTQNATVDIFLVNDGYALVILPGVEVTVNSSFNNSGTIYVFGKLSCNANYITNSGTINITEGGKSNVSIGTINNEFDPLQKVPAKAPTSTQSGWMEYWEARIVCGEDHYIEGYYMRYYLSISYKMEDLESWKAKDGKLEYNTPTKIDGQMPNAENGYVGWKDYYKQVCTANTGPEYTFYAENEEFTKPITDLEAWKTGEGLKCGVVMGEQCYILEKQDGEFVLDKDITFTDKDFYQSNFEFTVTGNLTYSRTFTATGVWQAWFVPFDVTVYKMNQAGMEVAKIAGVLMDGEVPYIAFAKMTDKDAIVKANTPYVVKANESSVSMTLTGPDICIRKSTDAELEAKRLTVQSSFDTFTFGGNYQPTNGYENQWYALNTSGSFQKMGDGANLAPQRFWMTIDTRTDTPYYTDESGASAKAFINMTVLGDDETTGIESLTPTFSEGKRAIYSLQGQKVNSIQKGQLYIMNGKKFFAR